MIYIIIGVDIGFIIDTLNNNVIYRYCKTLVSVRLTILELGCIFGIVDLSIHLSKSVLRDDKHV